MWNLGFPCGSAGKESAYNAGDLGSISGLGRSAGEGKGYPLQYSGLENSLDCIVHGVEKRQARFSNHVTCTHLISTHIKIAENCCLDWGGYFVTLLSGLLCVFDTFHSQTQQED